MKIVVIGGGIGGLAVALMLAREDHQVIVLERDAAPPPQDPETAFSSWHRPGVPQMRHGHQFLAGSRYVLAQRLPDVLDGLLAHGVGTVDVNDPRHDTLPDPDLISLTSRRPLFEWVLRRVTAVESGVRIRAGVAARGLVTDHARFGNLPVVVGVETDDGLVRTDMVIDAAGRRSPVTSWLSNAGAALPPECHAPSGVVYFNRYYRLLPNIERPTVQGFIGAGGSLGFLWFGVLLGDGSTFYISLMTAPWDADLRILRRQTAFDAAVQNIEAVAAWASGAEPIMSPQPMAAGQNVVRPFASGGRLPVLGIIRIGDALSTTDPFLGWGATFALWHASAASDAIARHSRDLEALALDYDAAVMTEMIDRHEEAAATGRRSIHAWRGTAADATHDPLEQFRVTAASVADQDAVVARGLARRAHLLDRAAAILSDPDIGRRIQVGGSAERSATPMPTSASGPTRDDFIALITSGP